MGILDDILDFLGFLILGGMCIAFAMNIVLPMAYETQDRTAVITEDKTAPHLGGDEIESSFDGSVSTLEAVLMTQIQDYGMPDPKRYRAGGMEVEVTGIYRALIKDYGIPAYSQLGSNPDTRFTVEYQYTTNLTKPNDYYYFKRK